MAISYINTNEVDNIAKEINSLVDDLNNEINNLFTRFSEVPTITQGWVGEKSFFYFNKDAENKKQYIEFINKLRDISYKLNRDSYEIQTCIKKSTSGES